jgi:hypothetical protein
MKSRVIAAVTATLMAGTPAWATSNVSPKHDGTYAGALTPVAAMSGATCGAISVEGLAVANGLFRHVAGALTLSGFVTEEGFVAGKARFGGAAVVLFEGRIEGTRLSGGIIDDAANCAWTVNLTRR